MIRSLVIGTHEAVESTEYTVDRAWNAVITVEAVKKGQGYEIDGQGRVQVRATVKLAEPSGVQWATGRMSGWLNFDRRRLPVSLATPRPSSISTFDKAPSRTTTKQRLFVHVHSAVPLP